MVGSPEREQWKPQNQEDAHSQTQDIIGREVSHTDTDAMASWRRTAPEAGSEEVIEAGEAPKDETTSGAFVAPVRREVPANTLYKDLPEALQKAEESDSEEGKEEAA